MVVLGPAGGGTRQGDYGWTGRVAIALLSACPLALAALSGALKVVVVPLVLRRLLGAPFSEDAPGVDSRSGGVMTWNGSLSPGVEPGVLVRRPPPGAPRVFTYDANVPVLR